MIFNNIRWGELAAGLVLVSGLLTVLQDAPIPEHYKPWIRSTVAALAYIVAFLRNPKTLDWQAPADDKKEDPS